MAGDFIPVHHVETKSTTATVEGGGKNVGERVPVGTPGSNSVLIQNNTQGGSRGSSSKKTSEKVVVDTSQGPVNLVNESLQKKAAETARAGGYATEEQNAMLPPEQILIYLDYEAVQRYNEESKKAGINDALDYFSYVKYGLPSAQERTNLQAQEPTTVFFAPRVKNPSGTVELESTYSFSNPIFEITGGEVHASGFSPSNELPPPYVKKGFLETGIEREQKFYENIQYKLELAQAGKSVKFLTPVILGVKFAEGAGKVPFELIQTAEEQPLQLFNVVGGTLQGAAQLTEELTSGQFLQAAETSGKISASAIIFHKAGQAIDFALEYPQHLKFLEATSKAPKDTGYQFFTQSYSFEGRQGVIVPPEYLGALNKQNAPELQTQLYPKQVEGIGQENSIFAPAPYQPLSLLELAKKNPALAKELAKEFGQTVFNPEAEAPRLRDLTSEERLAIAKKQAGVGEEVQKTLGGFNPNAEEVLILKNNKVIARLKKGEVEIRQPPIFAVEPLTAAAITIFENREILLEGGKAVFEKFKRESEIIAEGATLKEIKPSEFKGFVIKEGQYLTPTGEPILVTSLTLGKEQAQVPKGKIKYKLAGKTKAEVIGGQRAEQALSLGAIQAQSQSSEQVLEEIQIQQPEQRQELSHRQAFEFGFKHQESIETAFSLPNKASNEAKKSRLIGVQVRKKGKFETIGSFKEEKQAFNQGLLAVRARASASFRLVDLVSGLVIRQPQGFAYDIGPSKKETGVYIQKRKFRISSPGEKADITYKGIAANRNKKKKIRL